MEASFLIIASAMMRWKKSRCLLVPYLPSVFSIETLKQVVKHYAAGIPSEARSHLIIANVGQWSEMMGEEHVEPFMEITHAGGLRWIASTKEEKLNNVMIFHLFIYRVIFDSI